jgi:hypothetical protein
MIHFIIYNTSTGIASQSGSAVELPDISIPGFDILQTEFEYDYKTSRVVDGNVITIPEKPSYTYEWVDDQWVDQTSILQLKTICIKEIDIEREKRNNLPIEYLQNTFDADFVAQRNISVWMTNIANGQNPPTGFVWRDFNNINHPADANFIIGLGNAVILRGTQLYQSSWIKKAEVEALTTAEAVKNYDVTTGW